MTILCLRTTSVIVDLLTIRDLLVRNLRDALIDIDEDVAEEKYPASIPLSPKELQGDL
jgi:hypothetical protein